MTEFAFLISIVVIAIALLFSLFFYFFKQLKTPSLNKAESGQNVELSAQVEQSNELSAQPNMDVLDCRVQPEKQEEGDFAFDTFSVEICGSIHAPSDINYTTVRILITDITDEIPKPVHSHIKQWQKKDSPTFCYNADLGKLPKQVTTISDWMAVAHLKSDRLTFPRKGKRKLQFNTSILSRESGEKLACAKCTFIYENTALGYIDLEENFQRTKTLAIALAFTVSSADDKLYNCEIEFIKNWARDNFKLSQASNKARRKLEKALNKTVRFFRQGNKLDTHKICKEIVEIAPVGERYDILELCLHVAKANGIAVVEELAILKNIANWLEVDNNRFHEMMEKILPVNIHEVADVETALGVTSDMDKEKTRQHLNKEYRKWNARVTNFDPEIQTQADYMLRLIADARSEYVGQGIPDDYSAGPAK